MLDELAPALRAGLRHARSTSGPVPPALRDPTRLGGDSDAVLAVVRAAVESDDAFRAAVAASTTEEEVGATGWAWLLRLPGWDERLFEVVVVARHAADERLRSRDLRSAARRLEASERRLDAARARMADLEAGLATAEEERLAAVEAARGWRGGPRRAGAGGGGAAQPPDRRPGRRPALPRPSSARSGPPGARPRPG